MQPASLSLPPGTRVDRYEVHNLLGEGGYGAVYRARHVLTDQWVALKVLRREDNVEGFDRLEREARAVAQLGSAHVVKVFDAGVANEGLGFLAMELLSGCDLAELVRREGPFGIARSIDLTLQSLEGLAVAHERGIVHRDMKPANVFVTRTEQGHDFVKLLDFGISKMRSATPLTAPGLAMGTPGYMAPEMIANARDADARADLFSVAVMLYEMLARTRPYAGRSFIEYVDQVQTGRMTPLRTVASSLPEPLVAVVERGLSRDPDGRWQSARAFASALRKSLEGEAQSISATPGRPISFTPPAQITPVRSAPPVSVTAATMMAQPTPAPAASPSRPSPSRSMVPFVVVGALVAAAIAGTIVYLAVAPSSAKQANAAPAASQEPATPPDEADEADDDDDTPKPSKKGFKKGKKKKAAPAPAPDKPQKGPPAAVSGGVTVEEPQVVGELDTKEIRRVLKKAAPEMEECRIATEERVLAAAHVHGVEVSLAGPAPENKGNEGAARCVATRFKEAAKGWKQAADDSGIIFFEVTLKAK